MTTRSRKVPFKEFATQLVSHVPKGMSDPTRLLVLMTRYWWMKHEQARHQSDMETCARSKNALNFNAGRAGRLVPVLLAMVIIFEDEGKRHERVRRTYTADAMQLANQVTAAAGGNGMPDFFNWVEKTKEWWIEPPPDRVGRREVSR